jgi:hypothetical protein
MSDETKQNEAAAKHSETTPSESEVAKPKEVAAANGSEKEAKKNRPDLPDYSPIEPKNEASKSKEGAAGMTDALVLALVAAVVAGEAKLDRASAAVSNATIQLDAGRAGLAQAKKDIKPTLKAVDGVLRATTRGREFRRNCKAKYAWDIYDNIAARLPESGLTVPAELMLALATEAAAGHRAQTAFENAEDHDAQSIAAFKAAKEALHLGCLQLNAGVRTSKLGVALGVVPPAGPPVVSGTLPPGTVGMP